MQKNAMVQKHLFFLPENDPQIIAYHLKDNANQDSWQQIIVIFNWSELTKKVTLPKGTWKAALQDYRFNAGGKAISGTAVLAPYSAMILYQE